MGHGQPVNALAQRGFSSVHPPDQEQAKALAAAMPPLAGRQLEAPYFFETAWEVGQRFPTESTDPDRTQEAWLPPAFALDENPAAVASGVVVEELPIPEGSGGTTFARVLRKVLTEDFCVDLLSRVNAKGFTPALVNMGRFQQLMPDYRNGHRIIVDSPELAAWLFEVLRAHLPEQLSNGARLVGLNERLRFLCYTPGQFFEEHFDGRYTRPAGHPNAGDFSAATVQLYLHDVPAAFGGATAFTFGSPAAAHQPEAGSVLLFSQNLPHEGQLVTQGVKYTLRTEAMYRHP